MYPWHGNPHPHSNPHSSTASTTPSTQYQMPHLRWHPSMMSRSQHHHQHHQNATSLPTMSSNLRMAQNSNHQPVSVVVESRQPTTTATTATTAVGGDESVDEGSDGESDNSDSGMGTSRDMVVLDAPGDPEYVASPEMGNGTGNGRRGAGSSAGLAITTTDDRDLVDGDGDDLDTTLNPSTHNNNQTLSRGGDARKHGKRLTTKEEVSLFNICNHHADEFGQRSNLCKWWNTVTDEFTRDQGHPYSWHSVRRKVEMVTKQRMKFLEEQRDKGGNAGEDLSNPRWRAAVDAWIPTWQRWEEAEAKRIEKRDSRKTRKRKSRAWDYSWETTAAADAWRAPSSPVGAAPPPLPLPSAAASIPAVTAPAPTTTTVSTSQNSVPVRLPPGFDSMFSNPNPSPPTPQTQKTTPYSSYHPTPPAPTPPETSSPAAAATATESMTTALLQTLGKLNKHLDAAAPDPHPHPHSSASSPFISALVSTTGSQTQPQPQHQHQHSTDDTNAMTITPTSLSMLKEELRREMQDELRREIEKDRASLEEKLDSVQRTQEMILEMLRQEPA